MTDVDLTKLEKAIAKTDAPKQTKGVEQMLDDIWHDAKALLTQIEELKRRMAEFNQLSVRFYNGK